MAHSLLVANRGVVCSRSAVSLTSNETLVEVCKLQDVSVVGSVKSCVKDEVDLISWRLVWGRALRLEGRGGLTSAPITGVENVTLACPIQRSLRMALHS